MDDRRVPCAGSPPLDTTPDPIAKVANTLHNLTVRSQTPNLVVNGSSIPVVLANGPSVLSRDSASDESHRADSGSELGTKPPSLDGKSITSGTTFALDEKESLRPDDSASVKAAAEDEDSVSIRGSFLTGSRVGSEVAPRGRLVLPDRRLTPSLALGPGVTTPQSISSGPPRGDIVGPPSEALDLIYSQAPDDKLIEALASPRDKYFLLRLEKDVIEFVQDSKEPYMDLPPSNSFCRMLTHKLADYYHMTHSFEPNIGSVRIFRTPFCRVPPPLAMMSPPTSSAAESVAVPVILPKKIMRRGQDDESGALNAGSSKVPSEADSDAKDAKEKQSATNPKLSREEREEMYKAARERIFGSSEEAVSSDQEAEHSLSRTSSASANRSNGRKSRGPRQRRDDLDNYYSRNQYVSYWNNQPQAWNTTRPHPEACFQGSFPGGTVPQGPMPSGFMGDNIPPNTPQGQHYMGSRPGPPFPLQQFPGSVHAQQAYGQGILPMSEGSSFQNAQGPVWPQPAPALASSSQTQPGQPPQPYAFGQLPTNAYPHDPKSQHPVPGSYNRNYAFNPKTQSFIPSNGQMSAPAAATCPPQPISPSSFSNGQQHQGRSPVRPPHHTHAGYQQRNIPSPHGGYGMARQGSNTSGGSFQGSPRAPSHPFSRGMSANPTVPPYAIAAGQPSSIPPSARQNAPRGTMQAYGNLPTYGNPATLPQKPQ